MDRARSDSQYFLRRAEEERAAAQCASDPRARKSHIGLAERYAEAARTVAAAPRLQLVKDGSVRHVGADPAAGIPDPALN